LLVLAWLLTGSINDSIDRCDDPSSGKYITDPAARALECKR